LRFILSRVYTLAATTRSQERSTFAVLMQTAKTTVQRRGRPYPALLFAQQPTRTLPGHRFPLRALSRLQRPGLASRLSSWRLVTERETSPTSLLIVPLGYVTTAVACLWVHGKHCETSPQPHSGAEDSAPALPQSVVACYRQGSEVADYRLLLQDRVCLSLSQCVEPDHLKLITHVLVHGEWISWLDHVVGDGLLPSLRWIGLLSSTSLYAPGGESWIDESAPLDLSTEKAAACWQAEQRAGELAHRLEVRLARFRLGAVYGPIPPSLRGKRGWTRRSVLDTMLAYHEHSETRQGSRRPRDTLVNRIHVADAARLLLSGVAQRAKGVFNLVDNEPATRAQVEDYAAQSRTGQLSAISSESRLQKRIRNHTAKAVLLGGSADLWYPSYREGIRAIAQGEMFPFHVDQLPERLSATSDAHKRRNANPGRIE
jgi:hypothetical protein